MKPNETSEENPLVQVTRFEISSANRGHNRFGQKAITLHVLFEGKELQIDMELALGVHFANKTYKGKPRMKLAEKLAPDQVRLCFRKGREPKISSEDLAAWVGRVETEISLNRKTRSKKKRQAIVH